MRMAESTLITYISNVCLPIHNIIFITTYYILVDVYYPFQNNHYMFSSFRILLFIQITNKIIDKKVYFKLPLYFFFYYSMTSES